MGNWTREMLNRILWILLLIIGVLIFVTVTLRGPAPAVNQASRVDLEVGNKATASSQEKELSKKRAQLKEGKYQILQDDGPINRLQVISNQPSQKSGSTELFDGTLVPTFDPDPPIRDYDDLQFFTIIMSPNISEQMLPLRALIGSIHQLRQGRGYVPKFTIFTPIVIKDIPVEVLEEINWWNRVTLQNMQAYLGLPLVPLNLDLDEHQLRLSLAERLVIESGHALWIHHGYVFEPRRIPIWRAERSGSSAAFLRAYDEGRRAMMELAEQLITDGYLLVQQSTKQLLSNALQSPKGLVIPEAPGGLVMEGYTRDLGLRLIRDRLRCSFSLGACQESHSKVKEEVADSDLMRRLDSSTVGIYPLDPSSGSQCMIEVREANFQNFLLANVVTAMTSPLDSFTTYLSKERRMEAEPSGKPTSKTRRVALALPTTSKGMKADEEAVFLRVLLPSLLKTVTDSEWASFVFTIYVGYDHGDEYYENPANRQQIIAALATLIGARPIQVRLLQLPKIGRVALLWNLLYLQALRDGTDYFFQVNDDLTLVTPGWLTYFTETLDANQGFGVVGPADFHNALNCSILTMAMVTPVHYEIFGSLYPLELKDWKTDRWLTYIYQPDHMHCRQDVIANNGGAPTRYKHCEFLSYVIYVEAAKRRIAEWRAQRGLGLSTNSVPENASEENR